MRRRCLRNASNLNSVSKGIAQAVIPTHAIPISAVECFLLTLSDERRRQPLLSVSQRSLEKGAVPQRVRGERTVRTVDGDTVMVMSAGIGDGGAAPRGADICCCWRRRRGKKMECCCAVEAERYRAAGALLPLLLLFVAGQRVGEAAAGPSDGRRARVAPIAALPLYATMGTARSANSPSSLLRLAADHPSILFVVVAAAF